MGKHYVIFVKKNIGIRLFALPFRGGRWMYGSEAGVFALYLDDPRSNSSYDIGFRSALFHKGLDYVCCLFVVVLLRRIALQACSL